MVLGFFLKAFPQAATYQGYFPKLPKSAISQRQPPKGLG